MMHNLLLLNKSFTSVFSAVFVIISKNPLVSALFLVALFVLLCRQDLFCIYASSEIIIGLAFSSIYSFINNTKTFNPIVLISRQLMFYIINEITDILQTYLASKLLNTKYIRLCLGVVGSYFKVYSSLCLTYPNLLRFLTNLYVLSLFLAIWCNDLSIHTALVTFTVSALAMVYISCIDNSFQKKHPFLFTLFVIVLYTLIILSILYISKFSISLIANAILKTKPCDSSKDHVPGTSKGPSGSGPSPNGGPEPDGEAFTGHAPEEKEKKADKKWYDKNYYEANKDKIKREKKIYYEANKEKHKRKDKINYEANKEKNKVKKKLRDKNYYKANKDKIKQYDKDYYEANKDKIKQNNKDYYGANKDKIKQNNKDYYEANKDNIKQNKKDYYANKDQRKLDKIIDEVLKEKT